MLERPNTQFAIYRSPTVGDNQSGGISAMVLAGTRIRGVIVDNPSGSWVKLSGTGLGFEPYIAPYTLAWSVSLLPSVLEIGASYVTGPTGQPASTAGSPIVVYLFEAQVPSSGGSQFVVPAPDTVAPAASTIIAVSTGGIAGVEYEPAIVATRRMRLFSVQVGYHFGVLGGGNPNHYCLDSPVYVDVRPKTGAAAPTLWIGTIALDAEHPQDSLQYPNGFDLELGDHLLVDAISLYGQVPVVVTPIYALV